uniref:Putative acetyltransferase n=1 Tax=viral metagenome TaxID=1070528 RepID=A0A6M3K8T1_9ZZZZ
MAENIKTTEELFALKEDIVSTEDLFGTFERERPEPLKIEPNLPQYLKYKLNVDRASSERSKFGRDAMFGKMDNDIALSRGNEERDYWMAQAGPYENLSFKKAPFKYVAGETAQLIPYMISSQKEGLKYGLTLGGGFAAITALAGQVGPQVMLPEEVITVPVAFGAGMTTGYSYGVIKNILDREGGGLYLDLVEKGISPETARPLALAGGTMIGIIELAQFKLLSKPFKQAFSKVVKSDIGKKAISQAIGRYVKTYAGEIAQEDLQEISSLTVETIAGLIDEKPDAIPTKKEWMERLLETTKAMAAGMAVISAPGAVVDVTSSIKLERIGQKKDDIALLDKIIAEAREQDKPRKAIEITPEGEKVAELPPKPSITAPKAIEPTPSKGGEITLKDIRDSWKARGIENYISEGKYGITLSDIRVPKEQRGQGIGTQAIKELIGYADKTGQRIILTPSKDFGATSVARLKEFYKKLGFVENKGRNKDYQIRETMYREPTPSKGGDVDIAPERIKPDISGITPIQKQIDEMAERQEKVTLAQDALNEIDTVRDYLKRRITKYKDQNLKEELTGIPSIFIKKEGGISPDEAMEELRTKFNIDLRSETELKEYLQNLEQSHKDLLAQIEEAKPGFVRKRETTLLAERVKAAEQGIREGTIKTKKAIKELQTELIETIEETGLEAKDKAKFLRTIKNVQTVKQFEKALPEISERLSKLKETAERKGLTSELKELLENVPKTLPIEYKEAIEGISQSILPKVRTEKEKANLVSMRDFVQRQMETGEEINIPHEKLSLLDKRSTDEMSIEELKDLNEVIQRLYHQGRLKNKLLTALQARQFEDIKTEIINTITQGKGINEDSSIVKALREQNKNLTKASLEKVRDYIITNLRPELMLNILDGMAPGIMTNTLFNPLWESQKAELTEAQKVIDTIKDIHKKINFTEFFVKKHDIGRFKGMTKDMACFIYANSFNDANMLHLTGSGITEADLKAIEIFLSNDEKQAVNDQIRFYDEYQWPILDGIYTDLEGVHLGKEFKYFPIDRLEDVTYVKELEQDILQRAYVRRAGVSKGFTKERVTSSKGFSEFSYFGTILRNYRKVEHYKAYAKSVRDANKILSNKEIKQAIKEKMGDKYYQVLEKWLKDVAYGGDRQSMADIDRVIQWLRTNYATAVIGGNLLSVMKAPVSYVQGAEMAGKYNTLKASLKFLLHPLDWNEKIADKSTLMKFRAFRQERELGEIISQRSVRGQIGKLTGYQLIREKSMLPWVIADKATTNCIWLASYEGAKSDNLSEQEAINHADMVIRRTQPMSGALNLPDTFRGPEYQKLFTLFRNQPNQNFNLLAETVLKGHKISKFDFSSHMVFYLIVPSIMIGVISRKRLPEDLGELARDVLNGALGGLIYIGNVTNMMASGFMGATTPIESLYEDIYNAYMAKDIWKKLDHITRIMSKLTGFPYIGIKRLIKGEPFGKPAKTKSKGLQPI